MNFFKEKNYTRIPLWQGIFFVLTSIVSGFFSTSFADSAGRGLFPGFFWGIAVALFLYTIYPQMYSRVWLWIKMFFLIGVSVAAYNFALMTTAHINLSVFVPLYTDETWGFVISPFAYMAGGFVGSFIVGYVLLLCIPNLKYRFSHTIIISIIGCFLGYIFYVIVGGDIPTENPLPFIVWQVGTALVIVWRVMLFSKVYDNSESKAR